MPGYSRPTSAASPDQSTLAADPSEFDIEAARASTLGKDYIGWLEGVRAVCALYVVLHHIYIGTMPDYELHGNFLMGWLVYGQLAVVAFIVVSGYSLTLKPTRDEYDLKGGALLFYKRRAWRILPPYWAALVLAMLYHTIARNEIPGHEVNFRSFIVHALLLQDILHSNSPNGAFWSIAVEAQIYILFPFILAISRRLSPLMAALAWSSLTVVLHLLARNYAALSAFDHLSPQLFIAFLLGFFAASIRHHKFIGTNAFSFVAMIANIVFVVLLYIFPLSQIKPYYFWLDIFFAADVSIIFLILSRGPGKIRWLFGSYPLRLIGSLSYSLYLTHLIVLAPILAFLGRFSKIPDRLTWMYMIGIPCVLFVGSVFFFVFEKPFLTIRSWRALYKAVLARFIDILRPHISDDEDIHRSDPRS